MMKRNSVLKTLKAKCFWGEKVGYANGHYWAFFFYSTWLQKMCGPYLRDRFWWDLPARVFGSIHEGRMWGYQASQRTAVRYNPLRFAECCDGRRTVRTPVSSALRPSWSPSYDWKNEYWMVKLQVLNGIQANKDICLPFLLAVFVIFRSSKMDPHTQPKKDVKVKQLAEGRRRYWWRYLVVPH